MKTISGLLKHGEWVDLANVADAEANKILTDIFSAIIYKKESIKAGNSVILANAFIAFKVQ